MSKATAGSGKDPLEEGPQQKNAFREMKRPLTSALALGLLDMTWDFKLFMQRKITALGVLTETAGPRQGLAAYLPKRLDPVAVGWLPCLQAFAATAVLVREAGELILGQNINVKVPHAVTALMNS